MRKEPGIPAQETSSTSKVRFAQSIKEFTVRLQQEDIEPWQLGTSNEEEVRIELSDSVHDIPKYTVVVNSVLEFTVFVFHWPVPDENPLYKESKRSLNHINVVDLLRSIESAVVCDGLVEDVDLVMSNAVDPTKTPGPSPTSILRHSVPKSIGVEDPHFEVSLSYRAAGCQVLTATEHLKKSCKVCMSALNAVKRAAKAKSKSSAAPAKPKAPLSACGPEKLKATVVSSRLQVKDLVDRLQQLQKKIQQHGIGVSEALEKDILTIMGGQSLEATPHMKFFWQEQMKLLQSSKMGRRYHPQVIRFALSIHSKSPSAYRELRDSGALILPSQRVLRDYKNYFKPKPGISKENVESLCEKISSFSPVQRYVAIIMDEMKIQANLVFDKVSGDLVGFIDLGDPMTNFASISDEDVDPIASHALAFLVRGLCTDLKHIIAYFFTGNVTSYQIMPLFWRTVAVLEVSLKLYVCAAVNDGASPNRKFFRLHSKLAKDVDCDVVYKTPNVYAPSRFIFFFADSPHLLKTARNCLYNSGSGSRSRLMWSDGKYVLFRHIADLFYSDQEFALHALPKLTLDHIVLTPYSKMKVKLAVQVLSKSVAIALRETEEDVSATADFCDMTNGFFDCTNVRSLTEHSQKNPFIMPYTTPDDYRFTWLKDTFLNYLEMWKKSTMTRDGSFSDDARQKMFLSAQTYEGLKIAVYSHIEVIKFLLAEGFQYVLTERLMQDVLEDYFGHQRERGRRSDNPSAYQFGYNDLTIAAQRDIAPVIRGNTGGRYEKVKWHSVSNEPVRKRTKKK